MEPLQPLLLLLNKVGVGAGAGGGQSGQAAMSPRLIPGGDGWRRRWSRARRDRNGDLRWNRDGSRCRGLGGNGNGDGGHTGAVVGVVGGGVVLLLVVVMMLVLME